MSLRELSEGAGLVGVGPVEVRYEFLCVPELRGKYPRGLFVGAFISGPSDQVQELAGPTSPVDLRVENLGDLVLWFTVDFDGRRRCLDTSGDGVRSSGLQLRDMENRMNGTHGVR